MTSVSMMMMTVDTDRLTKTKRIATSTRGSEMFARSKGGTLERKAERLATWRAKVSVHQTARQDTHDHGGRTEEDDS